MNTYDSTIKIKPVDVKSSTYIDFNVENNDKDRKFKSSDHVRISIYIYIQSYVKSNEILLLIKCISWFYPFFYICFKKVF